MSVDSRAVQRDAAWQKLRVHATRLATVRSSELIDTEAARWQEFTAQIVVGAAASVGAARLLLDFTRQRVDRETLQALCTLADACDLRGAIAAMYRGDPINQTENRSALHVALRQPRGAQMGGADIEREVFLERTRMLTFAQAVRSGAITGSSGQSFTTVVNIGIGGSDLGPAMAAEALRQFTAGAPRTVFISNVDGCALADTLASADPRRTLFIIASKTFTTQETMANARSARAWLAAMLGEAAVPAHFAAVSVNAKAMNEFGVHPDYRFMMWDWVGGRYSLWSSIGVSLAIAIGAANFEALLSGAHAIDIHFRDAPWSRNLPALMALIGVWNINFLALPTLAVLPYDSRLSRFSAYLQQLEMESNGKGVTRVGAPVVHDTAPVIWGEPGNNAQHSFFQLLHQGTARAAFDFVLPVESSCGWPEHQELATANCLAQAEAFARGQSEVTVLKALLASGMNAARARELAPHKVHRGDRPSSILLFDRLDPTTLGALIALYEHKVFAQSVLWDINPFDQWGVELGKKLCEAMLPAMRAPLSGASLPRTLAALIQRIAGSRD